MKKVIIFGSSLDLGGAETSLVNFANEVAKYAKVDLVLVRDGVLFDQLDKKIDVSIIGKKAYLPFFKKVSKSEYDIAINYHDWNYVAQRLLNKVNAKRKILWVHNDRFNELPKLFKFTYSHFGKRNDNEVVAVSKVARDSHLKLFNTSKEITIIENRINTNYLNSFKQNVIVNVARGAEVKNHPLMIKLLKEISVLKPGIEFVQYGIKEGSTYWSMYKDELKNYDVKLKLNGGHPEPWSKIKGSVLVLPSTVEGQGMVLIEALSHNLNAVAAPFAKLESKEVESLIKRSKTWDANELVELIIESLDKSPNSINKVKKYQEDIKEQIIKFLEL